MRKNFSDTSSTAPSGASRVPCHVIPGLNCAKWTAVVSMTEFMAQVQTAHGSSELCYLRTHQVLEISLNNIETGSFEELRAYVRSFRISSQSAVKITTLRTGPSRIRNTNQPCQACQKQEWQQSIDQSEYRYHQLCDNLIDPKTFGPFKICGFRSIPPIKLISLHSISLSLVDLFENHFLLCLFEHTKRDTTTLASSRQGQLQDFAAGCQHQTKKFKWS